MCTRSLDSTILAGKQYFHKVSIIYRRYLSYVGEHPAHNIKLVINGKCQIQALVNFYNCQCSESRRRVAKECKQSWILPMTMYIGLVLI